MEGFVLTLEEYLRQTTFYSPLPEIQIRNCHHLKPRSVIFLLWDWQ